MTIVKPHQARRDKAPHSIVTSGRDSDLSHRVTARLVCACGHVVRGEPVGASPRMAKHITRA
jgi:hypothetical protein